jgi:hypothetical protein
VTMSEVCTHEFLSVEASEDSRHWAVNS